MERTFIYPDNLSSTLFMLKYWSAKDIVITFALVMLSLLTFVTMHVWMTIILAIINCFISMQVTKGYSILKLLILYIRFLFLDTLILKWRLAN